MACFHADVAKHMETAIFHSKLVDGKDEVTVQVMEEVGSREKNGERSR